MCIRCVCVSVSVHGCLSLYGGLLSDCFEWMIIVDLLEEQRQVSLAEFNHPVAVCVFTLRVLWLMFTVLKCCSFVCAFAYYVLMCVCVVWKIDCVLTARPISCKGGICCHRKNMPASWQCRQGRFIAQWETAWGQNYTSNLDVKLKRERKIVLSEILEDEDEEEKRGVGGWEKVRGLMGFKLQPEENRRRSLVLINSSQEKILQHADHRACFTQKGDSIKIVLIWGMWGVLMRACVNECMCVCLLKTFHIACILQSSCSCASLLFQQCSPTDCLAFYFESFGIWGGLISKLLEVGFDLALKSFNHPLPASIPQCCILAHIWMERSDPVWSRWDGGVSFQCFILCLLFYVSTLQRQHPLPVPQLSAGPDPHTLCNVKGGVWAVQVTTFNILEKTVLWSSDGYPLFTAGIQYIQYTYPIPCMPTMHMRHGCITRTRYRTPRWRPLIPMKVAHTARMPKSYPCFCDVLPTAHQFPWICQSCRLYIEVMSGLWNSLSRLWDSITNIKLLWLKKTKSNICPIFF